MVGINDKDVKRTLGYLGLTESMQWGPRLEVGIPRWALAHVG